MARSTRPKVVSSANDISERHAAASTHQPLASLSAEAALADQLHSAAIHLLRRLRREDDAGGLTAPQLSALSVVVFAGPITLGALAAAEQVRPPTMTRVVAALEQAGLVTRQRDPRDGRVSHIQATPQGDRLLQLGRSRRVTSLARQLAALSHEDRQRLQQSVEILERLVRPDPRDDA